MRHLRALHNYQGFFAVFGGLSGSSVARLKKVWAKVEEEPYFAECKSLMDKNFSALRSELESAARPVIPYLGFYQRDLVYLEESPTFKGTHVNLSKLVNIANTVGNCLQYQNSMYSWFLPNQCIADLIRTHRVLTDKEAHDFSLKIEPREAAVAPVPASKAPTIKVTENKKQSLTSTLASSFASGLKLGSSGPEPESPKVSPKVNDKASKLLGVDSTGKTESASPRRRSVGLSPGSRRKSVGNAEEK